jgi:hypothetical protein
MPSLTYTRTYINHLSHKHTHTSSLTYIYTHIHTYIISHIYTHIHKYTISLSLSHTYKNTSSSVFLSNTHIHHLSHTHANLHTYTQTATTRARPLKREMHPMRAMGAQMPSLPHLYTLTHTPSFTYKYLLLHYTHAQPATTCARPLKREMHYMQAMGAQMPSLPHLYTLIKAHIRHLSHTHANLHTYIQTATTCARPLKREMHYLRAVGAQMPMWSRTGKKEASK